MESAFKFRLSRIFRSSFGSCRSRFVSSDVVEQPVFVSSDFDVIECDYSSHEKDTDSVAVMKLRSSSSTSKPKNKEVLRRKISDTGVYFVSGEKEGRTCPPASPVSPLNSLAKEKAKKIKKPHHKNKKKKDRYKPSFSSCEANNNGWFSSEDETEDETERFFSSRSISSDTSSTCVPPPLRPRASKRSNPRRRLKKKKNLEMGICRLVSRGVVVEDSVAVMKRSSDPYGDFRTSMVEMIVEKQIFSTRDLEKLLHCFLSLNSPLHHSVIVEVFTEIWEALFSNMA